MTRRVDFACGALVVLPDGRTATITARQSGPITLWKADGRYYREDELRLPDEPVPTADGRVTHECRLRLHRRCQDGVGGVVVGHGLTAECGCTCHTPREPQRPRGHGTCVDCGGDTSRTDVARCRTCAGRARRKDPTKAGV